MIRVGRLTYLNVAPFFMHSDQWGVEQIGCVPSELGQLAARGEVDAGPMPVADWFALERDFEPLGPYGIAATGPAQSVLLFSTCPIERLNGAIVGVTTESSTSVRLLRLVLEGRYGVHPLAYRRGERGQARLLIGDSALRERLQASAPFIYDLGAEWWRWRRLPFVFALWVVRRALPVADKVTLRRQLQASLEAGLAHLGDIAARCAGQGGLDPEAIVNYLGRFDYRLDERAWRGLAEFRRLLGREPSEVHDWPHPTGADDARPDTEAEYVE